MLSDGRGRGDTQYVLSPLIPLHLVRRVFSLVLAIPPWSASYEQVQRRWARRDEGEDLAIRFSNNRSHGGIISSFSVHMR